MSLDRSGFEHMLPAARARRAGFTVFGLGNLGSAIVRRLAKMGFRKLTLVDPDTVEDSNVATQEYDDTYLGWAKAEALRSMVLKINPDAVVRAVVGDHKDPGVILGWRSRVIVATDSIESRREIWEHVKVLKAVFNTWVDVRMALENLEMTILRAPEGGTRVDYHDKRAIEYAKALGDKDHLKQPCGARSIAYTGAAAAAVVCPQVRRAVIGLPTPYMVLVDLGRAKMDAIWRDGEEYTEEKFE